MTTLASDPYEAALVAVVEALKKLSSEHREKFFSANPSDFSYTSARSDGSHEAWSLVVGMLMDYRGERDQ